MRSTVLGVFLSVLLLEVSTLEDSIGRTDLDLGLGYTSTKETFEIEELDLVINTESTELDGSKYTVPGKTFQSEDPDPVFRIESSDLDRFRYTTSDNTPTVSPTEEAGTEKLRRFELPGVDDGQTDTFASGVVMERLLKAEAHLNGISVEEGTVNNLPKYSYLFIFLVYFLSLNDPLLSKIMLNKISYVEQPLEFNVGTLFEQIRFPSNEIEELFKYLAKENVIKMPIIIEKQLLDLSEKYDIGQKAVTSGDIVVISWLYKRGAIRPDVVRNSKRLIETIFAVELLSNLTVNDLSEIIPECESVICLLSKLGNGEIFEKMFQGGFNMSTVDRFNKTILEYAVEQGGVDLVKYFVSKGVSLFENYSTGDSLLHIAAFHGKKEMVGYLLGQGLSPDSMNFRGQTPWYSAARRRHEEIIDLMMRYGADTDIRNDYGDSQLHIAAKFADVNATEVLISVVIDVDIDNYGMTPLYRAAQFGRNEIIPILMDRSADLNYRRNSMNRLIHIAARNNHDQVVKTLIELGVDVNSRGSYYFTALHWAGRVGFTKVMQVLLDKGADIEARIDIGRTPLHEAAFWGQVEPCRLLIANGANIMATDNSGRRPSQLAKSSDHSALYLMLKNLENKS